MESNASYSGYTAAPEGGYSIDGRPVNGMSPEEAGLEIRKIKASPEYLDGNHPLHGDAVKLMAELYGRAYPDQIDHETGYDDGSVIAREAEEGVRLREIAVDREWDQAHDLEEKLLALGQVADLTQMWKTLDERLIALQAPRNVRMRIMTIYHKSQEISQGMNDDPAWKRLVAGQMLQIWSDYENERHKQQLKILGRDTTLVPPVRGGE